MTHEELIEKVAIIIIFNSEFKIRDTDETAREILETIFDALKEPTNEMRERGYDAIGDEDLNPTTLGMNQLWQAMLTASPLAPEGGAKP